MTEIVISNNKADKKQLAKLEKRIEANTKAAWRENGLIMLHIRNSGLYKAGYGTFEKYLEERWDIARRTGYQQLAAAEFVQKLDFCSKNNTVEMCAIAHKNAIELPANESQVRPLIECLNHDGERLHVWQEVAKAGEKITAALVQRKVDEFKASGQVVQDVEIKLPEVDVSLNNYRSIGSGENEWYTPQEYADMAREVMGSIDLDPASNAEANQTIKATTFYTKDDDGLKKQWAGNVWLNPPYSRDLMPAFVDKLKQSYMDGDVGSAILVSHNNTDTAWFHSLAEAASAICFPKNRIRFYRGEEVAAPTNGQAFFYLGNDTKKFASVFAETGFVVTPYGDVA